MQQFSEHFWYKKHPLRWVLRPLSWVYRAVTVIRRWYLSHFCRIEALIPVIVVGNITVGGVGKTPLVVLLAQQLQQKGLSVGIVSRGYGATISQEVYEIQKGDLASHVGDEPLFLAEKTCCPVVIAKKRPLAVQYLIAHHHPDIIISDDGLQHYRMGRAIEIVVIDGTRGLGNGLCLPAGPLREGSARLKEVDFVIANEGAWPGGYSMHLNPGVIRHIATNKPLIKSSLIDNTVAAVAGIGNPARFYSTLGQLGIHFVPYYFPDHHPFKLSDFTHMNRPIVMTEKDAVKCRAFSTDTMYCLPVEAQLCKAFWDALWLHPHLKGFNKHEI
jgi:tetraacyldisaccharide 4'-kinase